MFVGRAKYFDDGHHIARCPMDDFEERDAALFINDCVSGRFTRDENTCGRSTAR